MEDRYEEDDNIFTARITGGEVTNDGPANSRQIKMYFTVTETFKGTIPFERFTSIPETTACGISLQVGVEYLIFAPDSGRVGACWGILPVSGMPEPPAAYTRASVAALKNLKSGGHDGLDEPWRLVEDENHCRLTAGFRYGQSMWSAHINVLYMSIMEFREIPGPEPRKVTEKFWEMYITVPGREDLENHPMTLIAGDTTYTAKWTKYSNSVFRYRVTTADVASLIAELVDADSLSIRSSHPDYGEINAEVSPVDGDDSVARMHACMNRDRDAILISE